MQFRELVLTLQSELDTLRTETQTAQHESATAASQTAAMMSLNLKLQSSASKNQARNIDLEIKRIEAREAQELLSIVQVSIMTSNISSPPLTIILALPPPGLRRIRHGRHTLLPLLHPSRPQSGPHQQLRRPSAQPPRMSQRPRHGAPRGCMRDARTSVERVDGLQTIRDGHAVV